MKAGSRAALCERRGCPLFEPCNSPEPLSNAVLGPRGGTGELTHHRKASNHAALRLTWDEHGSEMMAEIDKPVWLPLMAKHLVLEDQG